MAVTTLEIGGKKESLLEEGMPKGKGGWRTVHGSGGKPKFYKNSNANQLFHPIIIILANEGCYFWVSPYFPV